MATWQAPNPRGAAISAYEIQFLSFSGDNNFYTLQSLCNGSSQASLNTLSCTFEMSLLVNLPLLLLQGDLITLRVRAYNQIGWSAYSDPNTSGVMAEERPSTPLSAPVLVSQAESTITLEMPEIFGHSTGGSEILSYNLQYNGGGANPNFISVIGEVPDSLLRTISKGGLTTNIVYSFRYRVRNKYGWSSGFSPVVKLRAATIP